MDKFDYITATIEEEKIRLENIIEYLENSNDVDEEELFDYKERYNNICKYLTEKGKYLNIKKKINKLKGKIDELREINDEYEVDNILLEDTLLSKFHEDTRGKYRNLVYDDIKNYDDKEILYLLFEKETNYNNLVEKRNKLLKILDEIKYPKTYDTLVSQNILIDKQNSISDDIFVIENNIKIEEDKISKIEDNVMTLPILKILYEFWIINSYDPRKVDKTKIFMDNKLFLSIKNNISEEANDPLKLEEESPVVSDFVIPDLNLPGINENTFVDIDGKDYVNSDK